MEMKKRLSQTDWLDHGLNVLASSGAGAVKVEPLAQSLEVSRGSFYWHFRDIGQFHELLLARWRERMTDDVIDDVERKSSDGARLQLLMRKAMRDDDALERAIRSWATQNSKIAESVAVVDKTRLEYLARILRSAGIPDKQVPARAAFIYWARLGRIMMGKRAKNLDPEALDAIARLLQS